MLWIKLNIHKKKCTTCISWKKVRQIKKKLFALNSNMIMVEIYFILTIFTRFFFLFFYVNYAFNILFYEHYYTEKRELIIIFQHPELKKNQTQWIIKKKLLQNNGVCIIRIEDAMNLLRKCCKLLYPATMRKFLRETVCNNQP
jgi:hypothetical protein